MRCILSGDNPNYDSRRANPRLAAPTGLLPNLVPIVSFDAGYDTVVTCRALAEEQVSGPLTVGGVAAFVLSRRRCQPGTATTRWHEVRVRSDPDYLVSPHDRWTTSDPLYGQLHVQPWSGLLTIPQNHVKRGTSQAKPVVTRTLIRYEVDAFGATALGTSSALALVGGSDGPGLGNDLAGVHRSLCHRASVSLLQTDLEMTPQTGALPLRRTAGRGSSSWPTSNCGWRSPLVHEVRLPWQLPVPLEADARTSPARLFHSCCRIWLVQRAYQNPAALRLVAQ